jgi:hypothetical protein
MNTNMPFTHTRFLRFTALLLFAALVLFAAAQNRRLTDARRAGLPGAPAYAPQASPFLNFLTVGLGGFRGVAAEVLWSRADRLQEQGRYFELVQLSGWITWLDPHATEAWTYNAWNMAYNISAMMRRPADRLRWVSHGIELLRDHGLPANPNHARLHRDLAWFYQHKIGSADDTAHVTYKLALAAAMAPLLNPDGTVSATPESRAGLAACRLDADRMLLLERKFGALDWRMAASHAVYWSSLGLEHAQGLERLACRRAVYQPLIQCVLAGRFTGDPATGTYRAAPNPAVIRPALQFLEETLRETPSRGVRAAYAFFLLHAIRQAQEAGDPAQAETWMRELNRLAEGTFRPMTLDAVLRGDLPEMLR